MITFYDYYLRGDTEADVHAAMAAAGIPLGPTQETSYDPIGTIYVDDAPIPGWHANLRLRYRMRTEQRAEMSYVLIEPPANPVRVWA